jgi:hypothetical protein
MNRPSMRVGRPKGQKGENAAAGESEEAHRAAGFADERLETFDLGLDCVRQGDGARGAQHPTFIQTCACRLYLVYILSIVYGKGYS